jgi:hypothetical protein
MNGIAALDHGAVQAWRKLDSSERDGSEGYGRRQWQVVFEKE